MKRTRTSKPKRTKVSKPKRTRKKSANELVVITSGKRIAKRTRKKESSKEYYIQGETFEQQLERLNVRIVEDRFGNKGKLTKIQELLIKINAFHAYLPGSKEMLLKAERELSQLQRQAQKKL
jgi:hypothetical protein